MNKTIIGSLHGFNIWQQLCGAVTWSLETITDNQSQHRKQVDKKNDLKSLDLLEWMIFTKKSSGYAETKWYV